MEQTVTATPQELQNDFVRFTVHKKPACVVEFNVEVLEPLVHRAHKQAIKAVAKEVSLPGFRKGKVPAEMVAKNFTKEIDKQWQQEIADEALIECRKLSSVKLLQREPRITYQMKSHSATGALLQLFLETEPEVPHVDPKQFHLKTIKRPEVNEAKIEETIRQSLLFFAKWESVTDRPVQQGDFVTLDVEIIETEPATPLFSGTRFEVTEKSMAQWMRELVLGKACGAVVEGVSVPDADASEEEKAELTDKKVRITIRSIDTAILPELTDEFVKQMGVQDVAQMRTNISQLLEKQADAHVIQEQRKQASEFLLTAYPFDLPATLIKKETEFRFQQLWGEPEFKTYWEPLSQEEKTKLIRSVHTQSEKAVRMFYLCKQVIADAQIKITAEDLPTPASRPLDLLVNAQESRKSPEVEHAEAYSRLILEKAEDFVIRNATVA